MGGAPKERTGEDTKEQPQPKSPEEQKAWEERMWRQIRASNKYLYEKGLLSKKDLKRLNPRAVPKEFR